jgi:hypothetical protein
MNDAIKPFEFETAGHPQESFQMALERFIINVNEARRFYYETQYPKTAHLREIVSAQAGGKKYIRIVCRAPGAEHGSAWCFVEVETGAILKCDGWKRPAKGVRGSIYSADWAGYGCSHNGPHYAR